MHFKNTWFRIRPDKRDLTEIRIEVNVGQHAAAMLPVPGIIPELRLGKTLLFLGFVALSTCHAVQCRAVRHKQKTLNTMVSHSHSAMFGHVWVCFVFSKGTFPEHAFLS